MDGVLTTLVNDQITKGQVALKLEQELGNYLKADGCLAFNSHFVALYVWHSLVKSEFTHLVTDPFLPTSLDFFIKQKVISHSFHDFQEETPLLEGTTLLLAESLGSWVYLNHHLGFVPEVEGFKQKNYEVAEDITCSLGSYRDLKLAGSQADVVFLRMDSASWLNAAGGCLLMVHGKKRALALKEMASTLPEDFFMTDMNAALALVQWQDREKIFQAKKEIFSHLALRLPRSVGRLPHQEGDAELILPYLPVMIQSGAKEVLQYAEKKEVEAKMAFEEFSSHPDLEVYPKARNFLLRCLIFPLTPSMKQKDVETLSKVLSTLP